MVSRKKIIDLITLRFEKKKFEVVIISRDREMVSRKAHNLKTVVRFDLPQQFGK